MPSLTADYALRAILVLAREESGRAVHAVEIADAIGAPRNYVAKVLNAIAKAGFVSSMRGPSGGFTLAVPASELTLGRVIDLFSTVPPNPRCMLGNGPCDPARPCKAHEVWKAVTTARRSPFLNTTIADLLEGRINSPALLSASESLNVA